MKNRVVLHYSLFLAIIFGAFASMAQNDYGLTVISWSCYIFALSTIIELIQQFNDKSWDKRVELFSLAILLLLFGLRAAYFHFSYVEVILFITSTLLIIIYTIHARKKVKATSNKRLKSLVILYYVSLITYASSMIITILLPSLTEMIGGLATASLCLFILGAFISGEQLVNGEAVKTIDFLRRKVGHSIVLMTGFLLISIYSGLSIIGILPTLYTDKIPHAYIELINDAETGKEEPVNGVYKHELYKEAYDAFLQKNELGQ